MQSRVTRARPAGLAQACPGKMPLPVTLALGLFLFSIPMEAVLQVRSELLQGDSLLSFARVTGVLLFVVALFYRHVCFAHFPVAFWVLALYLVVTALAGLFIDSIYRLAFFGFQLPMLLQMATAFLIVYNCFRHQRGDPRLWWAYVAGTCVAAGIQVSGLSRVEFADEVDRVGAFDYDPNYYAASLVFGLIMVIYLSLLKRQSPAAQSAASGWLGTSGRWLALAFSVVVLKAIVETGSRGALLALGAGLCLVAIQRGTWFTWVARAAAVAGMVWLASSQIRSTDVQTRWENFIYSGEIGGRETLVRAVGEMILERPLTGYGPVEYAYVLGSMVGKTRAAAHNTFLDVGGGVGLVGLVPYLVFVGLCFAGTVKAMFRARDALPLSLFGALMVACFTLTFDTDKPFWVVLAYCLAAGMGTALERRPLLRHADSPLANVPTPYGPRPAPMAVR